MRTFTKSSPIFVGNCAKIVTGNNFGGTTTKTTTTKTNPTTTTKTKPFTTTTKTTKKKTTKTGAMWSRAQASEEPH
jgi:hypothetical protein